MNFKIINLILVYIITILINIRSLTLKSLIPVWPSLSSALQISFFIRSLASSETCISGSVGKSKQF